ncbi:hypothetical protein E2C01_094705 [Portunus trituberculatus]|uniref:Uncharacterized protein n=1 Tax=Portunus trituberculatus TaxID=210409 RepID=A0A5B7JWU8_PORTR|nr:hypothetical protein [Portunus trituberculatus]
MGFGARWRRRHQDDGREDYVWLSLAR